MRIYWTILLVLALQPSGTESISSLVEKLNSGNFKIRDSAHRALRERPDAEVELRKILPTLGPESQRRVRDILDYYGQRPAQDLSKAAREGNILRMVELTGAWKSNEFEIDSWLALVDVVQKVHERHSKKGGESIKIHQELRNIVRYDVITEKAIDCETKGPLDKFCFLRTHIVDLDSARLKGKPAPVKNQFDSNSVAIIAAQSVRMSSPDMPSVIIAGGDVELSGVVQHCIVISGGSIRIKSMAYSSLLIARGNVICDTDAFAGNHAIAGKSVKHSSKQPNIIVENEPNPLGFIRWSDPKKKDPPKAK